MHFSFDNKHLHIQLQGLERVLAFKSKFSIPLKNIISVSNNSPKTSWKEFRAPGTYIPGLIKAGTFYTKRGKEFWFVKRSQTYLIIELKEESYKRIIVTTDENLFWKETIQKSITIK